MPDFCAGDDIITATNGQTRYFPYKSMLYNEENASQTYYGLWDATTSSPSGARHTTCTRASATVTL